MTSKNESTSGTIPISQAALLLMISDERVRQLVKQGYIERPARGRVPLVGAVQGYIRFLRDEDRRSTKSAADNRVREARAREIELRTAREAGELIPAEEAVAYTQAVVGALISRMNGLPAQITRNLDERRKIESMLDAIREEVAAVCEEHGAAYEALPDTHSGTEADDADRVGEK